MEGVERKLGWKLVSATATSVRKMEYRGDHSRTLVTSERAWETLMRDTGRNETFLKMYCVIRVHFPGILVLIGHKMGCYCVGFTFC